MATTTGSKRLLNISSEAMAASNSMTYGGLNVATEQFVSTQVSNLISSAPGALDTLNELAAAIGDDSNFATTVTNSIATKLDASVNPLKAASVSNDTITFTRADNTTFAITTSDANTDTNYYLNGITRSGNTLTFSVSGTTNRTYTFGSAAWAATTAFDAAGSAGSVNSRIDDEIIPLINGKADASHTHSYLPLAGGTITGSLTVAGSETRGTYTTLSQYHSGADNIVLKGNASGISSIFFESEKDGTNINHPSDFGFIQYHAYGTSTSGESNELIIGVSNDADDHVILNAPNVDGLKFRTGVSETDYTVYHSGNLSLATLGYTGASNANYITNNNQLTNGAGYVTSSGNTIIGTDSDINTIGSTIIDNIYVTDGVITSMGTRVLTLADLGFTGATNANYITNNNQLTNGAGYLTSLPNNAATFTNDITLSNSATTVDFIEELISLGAFQNNYKVFKVSWSYAGNSDLDVGFESVELAGCLIECWGGTYKHVRLTRPTTGTGGRSIYVYNDQGSSYSPGWRQIWTSDEFNSGSVSNWNNAYGWGNHASVGYLTTLGFSYSTGVTANHVVQRDANGYIYANYINFATGETENPTISSFLVSNGDGWSRKASVAHVKSQLGLGSAAYVATSAFDGAGAADAVNLRIDQEVLPAIPTNNNQLTNGAGYITGFDITTQTDGKYLRSNADDSFSGALTSTARNNGIFGTYDSTKTDHIWSMGTSYKNSSTGADFGNLYGLAYKHTNNTTGGTMAGGHQMVWTTNGNPKAALGENGVWTASNGTSANWKQAYDNYITGAAFSGTTTKTLTLTQRDGGTITASFTDAAGSGGDGYLSGLAFNTGNGILTGTVTGGTDVTVDLDGRYEGAGAAATVNDRIDTEVLPAIGAVTLSSLGFTGATNANYITNNTQISNGRGYLTSTNDRVYITDSRGAARAPSYYNDRYAQWDFQNVADTGVGGDGWHALLTVSKWSSYDNSHRQEQLIFSGEHLWRRTATSDSAWGANKKIWDSGNLDAFVGATVSNDTITFTQANGGTVAVTTSDANTWRGIDDTPVNGVTDQSISSNWAFDHVNASNPHGTSIYDLGTDEAEIVGFIATTMAKQMGWLPAYGSSVEDNVQWDDQEEAIKIKNPTDTSTGAAYKAVRVKAGDKVRFTVMAKASVNIGSGCYIRLYQYDGDMPDGKTHVSNTAGSSSSFVQEDSRGDTAWYENGSLTTSWKTFERTYTAPADGYVSLVVLNWDGAGSNVIYVSQPDIQFETNNAFIDASVSNDTITFTKRDGNTVAVTTSDANTWRGIHDTPVDGATTTSISSNWAFDNVKTAVPANAVFTDTVNTFDGAYTSLTGLPTLGTAAATASSDYATAAQGATADAALPKAGGTVTGTLTVEGDTTFFFTKSSDKTLSRIIPRGVGADVDKALFSLYAFTTSSLEQVRLDSAGSSWIKGGSLGIGTSSPTYALDVVGNAGFDEYIYHNGDSDTYIRLTADRVRIVAGGTTKFDSNSTYITSQRAISSTPTDGATTTAISSDWAFDNVKTAVPASAVFTDTVYTAGTGLTLSGTEFSVTANAYLENWNITDGTTSTVIDNGGTVELKAGNNVSISNVSGVFTISATDTDTQYSVGDGGLTQKNFTSTLKTKLDGIAANANNYSLPASPSVTSLTIGSGVTLSESTDRADLLSVTSSTSGWGGLQITNTAGDGIWSFMVDGAAAGIYDDQQGDWAIYCVENSYVELRHNGAGKLATTGGGISVTGEITASGDITAFSDARVKENIETIDNALDKVTQLRGVEYNKIGSEEKSIGVVAQEIREVLPEVVKENEDGMLSVAYGNITGVLIEAIKEQQKQIEELKAQLDGLTK